MGRIVWSATANRFGWGAFLGQEPGGASVPSRAVPTRVSSVEGLPPAFIGVGGIDLYALEDIEYARRLIEAGVPTQLLVVPGAFHGFDGLAADTEVAQRFNAAKLDALRAARHYARVSPPSLQLPAWRVIILIMVACRPLVPPETRELRRCYESDRRTTALARRAADSERLAPLRDEWRRSGGAARTAGSEFAQRAARPR